MPTNLSIPLPPITDPAKQCYFVRARFRNPVSVSSIGDDVGNTYVQSVAVRGINYGYFAMTPQSATTCRLVYCGGLGRTEDDLYDFEAIRVTGIAPSSLRALNFTPQCGCGH